MSARPVHGERSLELQHRGERYLVLADLHIGIEEELAMKGFRVPDQTGRLLEKVLALVEELDPSVVVLLGDVKHRIPLAGRRESGRVRGFLEALSRKVQVLVISGNHDAGIRSMAPDGVRVAKGLGVGPWGLIHGHAWPPEELGRCRTIIVGHAHPSVLLSDERGGLISEACWLRARASAEGRKRYPALSRVVVMPAFNDLRAGVAVNVWGARLLGPLLRGGLVRLEAAGVHLTDGTYLGRLGELMLDSEPPHRRRTMA